MSMDDVVQRKFQPSGGFGGNPNALGQPQGFGTPPQPNSIPQQPQGSGFAPPIPNPNVGPTQAPSLSLNGTTGPKPYAEGEDDDGEDISTPEGFMTSFESFFRKLFGGSSPQSAPQPMRG